MSNILNSDDFGSKIYGRFPPKYREDDVEQNFALKRYLQSLADGGFKHSIDEINGIANLNDPDKVDAKVLPILFQQYGLDISKSIPEEYLRYLLPKLGEAWSKKGTLSVIEFITASLSGVKTSTKVTYDDFDNPFVEVRFEMDYNIGGYFPNSEQFNKLLTYFLPFYCDKLILYTYMFYESQDMSSLESDTYDNIILRDADVIEEVVQIPVRQLGEIEGNAVLGEAILGEAVLGVGRDYADIFEDFINIKHEEMLSVSSYEDNSLTNSNTNTLNSSFITNNIYSYDKITIGGKTETVF